MSIRLKRVYEPADPADGVRFLVERLWPRGMRKDALRIDGWLKDVAPSSDLRRWFGHDPDRWVEFRKRYWQELDSRPQAWAPIIEAARRAVVTLVFSSHDEEHNNALALREYLDLRLGHRHRHHRSAA